jgi:hypothetical protein
MFCGEHFELVYGCVETCSLDCSNTCDECCIPKECIWMLLQFGIIRYDRMI